MTLGRRMFLKIAALIVSLVLLATAALWGVYSLMEHQTQWEARDHELRGLYLIGLDIAAAKNALVCEPVQSAAARQALGAALSQVETYLNVLGPAQNAPEHFLEQQEESRRQACQELRAVLWQLMPERSATELRADIPQQLARLHLAQNHVGAMAARTSLAITALQLHDQQQIKITLLFMGALAVAIIAGAVLVGFSQYRSVMTPLTRLTVGVRQIAVGRFSERLPVTGDRELAELAADFNRMADQLDGFYRELEEKVALKSKELVRSERLASVGFLAAGVAHEVNNPLSIIAGHAELALRQLEKSADHKEEQTVKALKIICDEAFRCKKITQKLLTLAQTGGEDRQNVDLSGIAGEVADLIGALAMYRERKLMLVFSESESWRVSANPAEMKQVLLNLTINALEATEVGHGQVWIEGQRKNGGVELTVRDNGRGMSAATLERVFEPFFTEHRGVGGAAGTGLGLSIVHAIVQSHGGRISAGSDGLGRGSRFTIELPGVGSLPSGGREESPPKL